MRLFFFRIEVMAGDNYQVWSVDVSVFDNLKTNNNIIKFIVCMNI